MAKTKKGTKPSPEGNSDKAVQQKINLDEQNALRCRLDEATAEVIRQSGYKEDNTNTYIKITLGVVSIGLALFAQFGPGKLPNNWWTVLSCVIGYIVTTTVLSIYCHLFEKDNFLICRPTKAGAPRLHVSSHIERFGDLYTLRLRTAVSSVNSREAKLQKSITAYFHSDGYLAEEAFKDDVLKVLDEFQKLSSQSNGSAKKTS